METVVTKEVIEDYLKTVVFKKVIEEYNIDVKDDTSLKNELDATSLKLMEALFECENRFKIRVPNFEIVRCHTFGDLVSVVYDKLNSID